VDSGLTDDLELVRQRRRGLERRQRPRRAELQLHDVVEVAAHHVDPLEHLAERDGEEAAGGRARAAAAERPRRERAAVQQPPPALQLIEVPAEVDGAPRRRLQLPRRRVRAVQVLLARCQATVQPGHRALRKSPKQSTSDPFAIQSHTGQQQQKKKTLGCETITTSCWIITDQELDLQRGHVVGAGVRVDHGRRRRRGRGADGQLPPPPPLPVATPAGTGYPRRALDAGMTKQSAARRGRGAARRRPRRGHGHGGRTGSGHVCFGEVVWCGAQSKEGTKRMAAGLGFGWAWVLAGITASAPDFPWRS
jgi:hypothetical protein